MRLDEIKAMAEAEGFQPFVIQTKAGLKLKVPHPEFLSIPPDPEASLFGVWTQTPTKTRVVFRLIDLDSIDHIEMIRHEAGA
jgi:hypothetical protein